MLSHRAKRRAGAALRAWARCLRALGYSVPPWIEQKKPGATERLLAEYFEYRRKWRGVKDSSLRVERRYVRDLLAGMHAGHLPRKLEQAAINTFLVRLGQRVSTKTLSVACTSIRSFLRFLHVTHRTTIDLSVTVVGPGRRTAQRPVPVLQWPDVRRLLAAVDRRSSIGKRDYAVFLMMATYGMGAAEVLGLRLDNVDWHERTILVIRRKTGVQTLLPLLDPLAQVLSSYLRTGRHQNPSLREVFVGEFPPHRALTLSALRLRLAKYAAKAGISTRSLGTHVLRHSHACRQIEDAVPPKVVGDILGHSSPSSISVYAHVATQRLRALCLPVPL